MLWPISARTKSKFLKTALSRRKPRVAMYQARSSYRRNKPSRRTTLRFLPPERLSRLPLRFPSSISFPLVLAQIAPLNLEFARKAVLEFLKSGRLPNTYVTIYRLDRSLQIVQPYTADNTL